MATKNAKVTRKKKAVNTWFIAVRGSYLPNNTAGWLTYIPFLGYLLLTLIVAFNQTDSNGLAILFIIPNWVAAAAVMTWIAQRKS
jgi:hypothetical protein